MSQKFLEFRIDISAVAQKSLLNSDNWEFVFVNTPIRIRLDHGCTVVELRKYNVKTTRKLLNKSIVVLFFCIKSFDI
jgi:hypothetical protein